MLGLKGDVGGFQELGVPCLGGPRKRTIAYVGACNPSLRKLPCFERTDLGLSNITR